MDQNPFNPFGLSNNEPKSMGSGEGEIPLAKPSDMNNVEVRTMGSDIKSMEESSGGAPRPYVPVPSVAKSNVSPENIFNPPQVEGSLMSSAPKETLSKSPIIGGESKKISKKLIIGIILAVVLIIILVAIYLFTPVRNVIKNLFNGGRDQVATEEASGTPTAPPTLFVETVPVNSEVIPSPVPEVIAIPELVHSSLFKIAANNVGEVSFDPLSLAVLQESFGSAKLDISKVNEFVFKDAASKFLPLANIVGVVFPGVMDDGLINSFEADYTSFAYIDSNGTWPGLIFKLKSESEASSVKINFKSQFEKAGTEVLANLYPINPGSAATWKQGKTGAISNNYLVYGEGTSAVSLNYAFVNNLLVISSSYDGFKAVLNRL